MSVGGLLLGVMVASSSVATSSVAGDDEGFIDLPLSAEDLALLDALETTATTATTARGPWWPAPVERVRKIVRTRFVEPVGRTIIESLELAPTVVGSFRGGERMSVSIQGGRVDPIVPNAALRWLSLPPLMLHSARLAETPGLTSDARTSVARIDLDLRAASAEPGATMEAAVTARSADRSAGVFATASVANEVTGLTFAARFDRRGPMRITTRTGSEEVGAAERSLGITARGRLLGGTDDPLRLDVGADYDATFNGVTSDGNERRHDTLLHAFFNARLAMDDLSAQLAGHAFGYRLRYDDPTIDETAQVLQVDGNLRYDLGSWFALLGGAEVALGSLAGRADGQLDRTEAFFGASVDTERFDAEAAARIARFKTAIGGRQVADTRVLLGARADAVLVGPLGFRVAAQQGLALLPPALLEVYVRAPEGHERTTTFEAGPTLFFDSFWLNFDVFATWATDTTVAVADQLRAGDARWIGVEADARWFLTDHLMAAGTVAYATATADEPMFDIDGVASVRLYGTVRYDIRKLGAYVAIHGRGTVGPFGESRTEQLVRLDNPDQPFLSGNLRFGATGGLALGHGLSLDVAVTNVIDTIVVRHDRNFPSAGVDLRVMVSAE